MNDHQAPRCISSLVLTCLTLSLLFAVVPERAFAARDVTGYRPARVCPGGAVAVIGSGFGDSQPRDTTVMVGQGSVARGPVPHVTRWIDTEVDVVLPSAIRAGTYWLKIYRGATPAGRAPESLVVRADCGSPAAVGLSPAARDSLTHPLRPGGAAVPGAARSLTPPGPAMYAVRVNIPRVLAGDDCDSVSPGDWMLTFRAGGVAAGGEAVTREEFWPSRIESRDVDTGATVRIDRSIDLGEIRGDRPLVLSGGGYDCDSDTWLPGGLQCSGEEFPEVSGTDDALAGPRLEIAPAEWTRGGTFHGRPGGGCGFSAWFEVTATRR